MRQIVSLLDTVYGTVTYENADRRSENVNLASGAAKNLQGFRDDMMLRNQQQTMQTKTSQATDERKQVRLYWIQIKERVCVTQSATRRRGQYFFVSLYDTR